MKKEKSHLKVIVNRIKVKADFSEEANKELTIPSIYWRSLREIEELIADNLSESPPVNIDSEENNSK